MKLAGFIRALPVLASLLGWPAVPRPVAALEPGSAVSPLLEQVELVVQGRAVDQERAPGGLWHRFRVEEVIWPAAAAGGDDRAAVWGTPGPTLRVFVHGVGVPEGAELVLGEEVILGASPLPPSSTPGLSPFLARLWESFQPDWPGERPGLAAADAVVRVESDASLAQAVALLVRGARSPATAAVDRRALLLSMAGHPRAGLREAALRQLARSPSLLDESGAAEAVAQFAAEVDGPADPAVLAAHLDLVAAARPAGAGPVLCRLALATPRAELARGAAEVLARQGSPADLRQLSDRLPAAAPASREWIREVLERRRAGAVAPGRNADPAALPSLLKAARRRLAAAPAASTGEERP